MPSKETTDALDKQAMEARLLACETRLDRVSSLWSKTIWWALGIVSASLATLIEFLFVYLKEHLK